MKNAIYGARALLGGFGFFFRLFSILHLNVFCLFLNNVLISLHDNIVRTAGLYAKLISIDFDSTKNVFEADTAIWAVIDPAFKIMIQIF